MVAARNIALDKVNPTKELLKIYSVRDQFLSEKTQTPTNETLMDSTCVSLGHAQLSVNKVMYVFNHFFSMVRINVVLHRNLIFMSQTVLVSLFLSITPFEDVCLARSRRVLMVLC